MSEQRILFASPMVRNILNGKQTFFKRWRIEKQCPYGTVGDELWVAEEWQIIQWTGFKAEDQLCLSKRSLQIKYRSGELKTISFPESQKHEFYGLRRQSINDCIKAKTKKDKYGGYLLPEDNIPTRWRNAKSMPIWASRILLEITGIRVERLKVCDRWVISFKKL